MEIKKVKNLEISKWRFSFFEVGLIASLSLVWFAFSITKYEPLQYDETFIEYGEDLVDIEHTFQPASSIPPPPLKVSNVITELDPGEREVEERPEIIFTSYDTSFGQEGGIEFPMEGIEETLEVFEFHEVSELAHFKGGELAMYEFIGKHLSYPSLAFYNDVKGKVTVQFVVMPDGSLRDVEILGTDKLGMGCEEAAMAVVKKMEGLWIPAKQRDKVVPMRFRLPIKFDIR